MQVGVFRDPFQLGDSPDVAWIGTDDVDGVPLDEILEVLAEIDLLAGVDRGRRALRDVAVHVGVDERHIVSADQVLEPHQVDGLESPRETNRVGNHPPRSAIEGEADLVAQDLFNGEDALDSVLEATLRDEPAVEYAVQAARVRLAVEEMRHLPL